MEQSSIEILERHKHHWHTLKNAGYINNLDYPVKLEIQSVIQAELDPHYHENLWCHDCLTNMIRRIYTHYEKYLAEEKLKAAAEEASKTMAESVDNIIQTSKAAGDNASKVFEDILEATEELKSALESTGVKFAKPSKKKSK